MSEVRQLLSLSDTKQLATDLAGRLNQRQIVLLRGPMGVGKSQLVHDLVEVLGGGATSSPTFAIINQYVIGKLTVDHVDLYRLASDDELEATGFWDLFSRPSGLVLIEWAERLREEDLPRNWQVIRVELSFAQDSAARTAKIS